MQRAIFDTLVIGSLAVALFVYPAAALPYNSNNNNYYYCYYAIKHFGSTESRTYLNFFFQSTCIF